MSSIRTLVSVTISLGYLQYAILYTHAHTQAHTQTHTHTFQVQENLQIPIQCDSLTFSLTLLIQGEQIGNFSSIDSVVNF